MVVGEKWLLEKKKYCQNRSPGLNLRLSKKRGEFTHLAKKMITIVQSFLPQGTCKL